jgi:CRISPR/Cas system-associated exonuclease Cas4 (RecB family)
MVNGTLIWYSYICDREVWFIGHQIEAPQDNPFLEKGRAIHEVFYPQYTKELLIDNTIKRGWKVSLVESLGKIPAVTMSIVLAIIFVGLGVYITSQIGTQANISVIQTLSTNLGSWATTWFPIILIVAAAAIVILVLLGGFGGKGR